MSVDSKLLISAVHRREPLWDQKNKKYHDGDVTTKLWKEVAQELGVIGKLFLFLHFKLVFKGSHDIEYYTSTLKKKKKKNYLCKILLKPHH